MDIPQQKYNPNQWVKYKYGNGQQISKIIGALHIQGKGWLYTITNPADQGSTLMTKEDDILEVIEA